MDVLVQVLAAEVVCVRTDYSVLDTAGASCLLRPHCRAQPRPSATLLAPL